MLVQTVTRNRTPRLAALGAALALAMIFVPGGDAQTDAPPRPSNMVSLYDKQGKVLFRALDRNFYGPGDHQDVLQISDNGILFKPTDSRDHMATSFLDLPFVLWQKRNLLLEFGIPAREAETENLQITVQRDGYNEVTTLTPDPRKTVSGTWSETIRIPRLARQIRLVIRSTHEKETQVPSKIAIWCDDPPLTQPLALIAGLIIVAACVLIWLMRQWLNARKAA
jgi:hypothetical protein